LWAPKGAYEPIIPAKRKITLVLLGLIFIVLPSCNTRKPEQKAASDDIDSDRIPITAPSVRYPAEQLLFHQSNLRFREQLSLAKNDGQRSAAVDECDKSRLEFFK